MAYFSWLKAKGRMSLGLLLFMGLEGAGKGELIFPQPPGKKDWGSRTVF
jgi:hypothetical protein